MGDRDNIILLQFRNDPPAEPGAFDGWPLEGAASPSCKTADTIDFASAGTVVKPG